MMTTMSRCPPPPSADDGAPPASATQARPTDGLCLDTLLPNGFLESYRCTLCSGALQLETREPVAWSRKTLVERRRCVIVQVPACNCAACQRQVELPPSVFFAAHSRITQGVQIEGRHPKARASRVWISAAVLSSLWKKSPDGQAFTSDVTDTLREHGLECCASHSRRPGGAMSFAARSFASIMIRDLVFQRAYSPEGKVLCRVCGSSPRCLIVDGNMKIRHQWMRGDIGLRDIPSLGTIVSVGEPLYDMTVHALTPLPKSRHIASCSDFTAERIANSHRVVTDVSGVFLAVCAHRVVYHTPF
jgi:hypothetical protein